MIKDNYSKQTRSVYNKTYRDKYKEELKIKRKNKREQNKDEINRKQREYRALNKNNISEEQKIREKEKKKIYTIKIKDRKREYDRLYRLKNKNKINKNKSIYTIERRKTDINFKIKSVLKKRLFELVKNNKRGKILNLLGCSYEQFKKHLESKFKGNMNWINYGAKGWHIDHIIPCSVFDLSKEEAQKFCFHYSNLQPMWSNENIIKGNRIDIEVLKKLDINLLKEKYKNLLAA